MIALLLSFLPFVFSDECPSNCKVCGSDGICTECQPHYFLNKANNQCENCYSDLCTTCTGPLQCSECVEGYTPDLSGQNCVKCEDEGCATCNYGDYRCITCKNSYYSVPIKDTDFFFCKPCNYDNDHKGCYSCTDYTKCDTCMSNYYKNGDFCSLCDSNCRTCQDSPTKCTSCEEGFYVDSNNRCEQCSDTNCRHCSNAKTCTECKDGYYKSGTSGCLQCITNCEKCDNKDTCNTCKTGFYKDDKGKCQECKANCDACNSTYCLDCAPQHYPLDDGSCGPCAEVCYECSGPSDKECLKCDPGYYFSRPNRNCFKCNEACSTCTGPNADDCTNCNNGYYMQDNKCVRCESGCEICESYHQCKQCKNGFYLHDNNGDMDCEPCSEGCMDCNNENHDCTKCFPGFYEATQGTSGKLKCMPCSQNCQSCEKTTGHPCTQCFEGYYPDNNKCAKCQLPCSSCSSETECTKCVNGYLLEGTSCKTPCSPECQSCEKTANNCLTCHSGYQLSGSTCIQCPTGCKTCEYAGDQVICLTCQDGYQKEGENCDPCHESCSTCYSESYLACYTCSKGYYKYNVATFPDYYTGECRKCEDNIMNCTECTSECIDDNMLSGSLCGNIKCSQCDEGTYLYNNKCTSCDSTCKTCYGPQSFQCSSCYDTFYLHVDTSTNRQTCNECDSTCNTCYGTSTNCTSCKSNEYLENNKCIACQNNCDECLNESFCTKCKSSFYIFNGICHQSCSELGDGFIGNDDFECVCGPGFILNGTVCNLIPDDCDNNHCDIVENANGTEYIDYSYNNRDVNGFHHDKSGGAIRAINVEFNSSNSSFNDCYSENGGGGAFFIYNTIKSTEARGQINLIKCTFTHCKSYYGGAVYIYHASEESPVLIESCTFTNNEIYGKSDDKKLTGGSALYLTAKKGKITDCIFRKNIGKGGSLKVTDDLSIKPEIDESHLLQHSYNKTKGSILINGCQFDIDQKSDCSLFYSNERQSLIVEVKDCVFTGSLKKDAHYIDGHLSNSQRSNLFINSCSFSADEKMALSKKIVIQNDAKNKFEKNNEYSWMLIAASTLAVAVAVVVVIAIIILKRNKADDDTGNSSLI